MVCTDVGGSKEVISKRLQDGTLVTYGKVVPPRNPVQLAEAQLEVMAMLGGLQNVVQSGQTSQTNQPSQTTPIEEAEEPTAESVVQKLQSAIGKVKKGRRVSITR